VNVIDSQKYKFESEPRNVRASCTGCGGKWMTAWVKGADYFQCPFCKLMNGHYVEQPFVERK
jgi:hypothetical protein